MARTASLTRTAAEALIGSPNDLSVLDVTGAVRQNLRKWCTAIGIASRTAATFSSQHLFDLYQTYATRPDGTVPTVPADAFQPTVTPIRKSTPVAAPSTTDANAKTFVEMLRAMVGSPTAVVDEPRTREIVAEMLKDHSGAVVTRLEVKTATAINVINGNVHHATSEIIKVAALAHPIMMVGPAGCGKTTIGEHVAVALGLPFYITSTVFDTHELLGFVDGYGKYHSTAFRQAFENGGVWVADEIDAWDAAALLAANSALANGFATFPDAEVPVKRHPDFRMIATANTFGHGADRVYVGRNELDAASLDRFATFTVDYDANLETALCNGNVDWLNHVRHVRKIVNDKNIRHVVSTRAIIMGSQALAAGLSRATVEELYLFKGMSKQDRSKITA